MAKGDKAGDYVTQDFCNERFNRILDKLTGVEKKLDDVKKAVNGRRWTSRETASTVAALIVGISAVVVAAIGYFG